MGIALVRATLVASGRRRYFSFFTFVTPKPLVALRYETVPSARDLTYLPVMDERYLPLRLARAMPYILRADEEDRETANQGDRERRQPDLKAPPLVGISLLNTFRSI